MDRVIGIFRINGGHHLLALGEVLSLVAEAGGGILLEEAGEERRDEGVEDNLGAAGRKDMVSKPHPDDKDLNSSKTYLVWGRDIHRTRTNLKV